MDTDTPKDAAEALDVRVGWAEVLAATMRYVRPFKQGHPAQDHARDTLTTLWDWSPHLQKMYRREETWRFELRDVDEAVIAVLLQHIDNLTRAMGQMEGRHQHGGDVGSTPSGSPNNKGQP